MPCTVYSAENVFFTIKLNNPRLEAKKVFISLNDGSPIEFSFSDELPHTVVMKILKAKETKDFFKIKFHMPETLRPSSVSKSSDHRSLGVGIISIDLK